VLLLPLRIIFLYFGNAVTGGIFFPVDRNCLYRKHCKKTNGLERIAVIYTVTLNPSLDYITGLSALAPGRIHRTRWEEVRPGGKGINVSLVLHNLGVDSKILAFIGGFTGGEIARLVGQHGCEADFIHIPGGLSRINVKIAADAETQINGQGPVLSEGDLQALFAKLQILKDGDYCVLAGSPPASVSPGIYERILKALPSRSIRIIADIAGEELLSILPYRPFLIKPCLEELEELFKVKLRDTGDIIGYAGKLQDMGAQNVLISMADQGAVLLDQNHILHQSLPPEGRVVSSVGAGDSMVAGFLAGYLKTGDYDYAFRLGLCTGSAAAFCRWLPQKEDITCLMQTFL
jgi:1-phosphofructokinase